MLDVRRTQGAPPPPKWEAFARPSCDLYGVMAIDWDFISSLEGGQHLAGYVPAADVSESGVTIATGIDLGQRTEGSIDALAIPDQLKTKLKPYAGLVLGWSGEGPIGARRA